MDQHQEAHRRAVEAQQRAALDQQSRLQRLNDDWDRQAAGAEKTGGAAESSTADWAGLAIGVVVLLLLVMAALLAWSGLGGDDPAASAAESSAPSRSATGQPHEVPTESSPPRGGGVAAPGANSGGDALARNGVAASLPAAPPMPDFTGKLRGEATAELEAVGHVVTVQYQDGSAGCTDVEAADESVLEQNPPAGEPLAPGAGVALIVERFSGAGVATPDVVGMTVDDARSVLSNLGLGLAFDTPTETGIVQWQGKEPCTRLIRGTDVLVVRAG